MRLDDLLGAAEAPSVSSRSTREPPVTPRPRGGSARAAGTASRCERGPHAPAVEHAFARRAEWTRPPRPGRARARRVRARSLTARRGWSARVRLERLDDRLARCARGRDGRSAGSVEQVRDPALEAVEPGERVLADRDEERTGRSRRATARGNSTANVSVAVLVAGGRGSTPRTGRGSRAGRGRACAAHAAIVPASRLAGRRGFEPARRPTARRQRRRRVAAPVGRTATSGRPSRDARSRGTTPACRSELFPTPLSP